MTWEKKITTRVVKKLNNNRNEKKQAPVVQKVNK